MVSMMEEVMQERCLGDTTEALPTPSQALKDRLSVIRRELSQASVATRQPGSLLVVKSADGERHVHPLREETVIGSGDDATVCVPCDFVSRKHCLIWEAEGCWMVEDLLSRNGLFVNGERVSKSLLKEGDIIQVGSASLIFLKDEKMEGPF